MNNPNSLTTQINALSPDSQNVLLFLAIYTAPLRITQLGEFCGGLAIEPDRYYDGKGYYYSSTLTEHTWGQSRLKTAINQLKKTNLIECPHHSYVQCNPELREQLVHHLVQSGQYQKYADIVFSVTRGYYSSSYSQKNGYLVENNIRETRHDLITGDLEKVKKFFSSFQNTSSSFSIIFSILFEGPDNWLSEINPEIRSVFLQFRLVQAISHLKPISPEDWALLLETANQAKCAPKMQMLMLDYALCAGNLDEINPLTLHGNMPCALLEAHQAFLSGAYEKAAIDYSKARGYLPGLRNNRTTPLHHLSGIFSALCDLHLGKINHVREMANFELNRNKEAQKEKDFHLNLNEAWDILQSIAMKLEGLVPARLDMKKLNAATNPMKWLSLLLIGHETAWFSYDGRDVLSKELLSLAIQQSMFPFIAAEATELAMLLGADKQKTESILPSVKSYRKVSKSKSLTGIITPKADWEIWLDSIRSLTETENTPGSLKPDDKDKATRLVWRAKFTSHQASFEPYEQVWSPKNQTWSQGRLIALSRLYDSLHTLDFLTEQDRRVASHVKSEQYGSYYKKTIYSLAREATRELINHPLIFRAEAPTVRVELVQAKPEIIIEKEMGKSIHISFFPPLTIYKTLDVEEDDSTKDLFVFEETKTRYKVISLSKKEQKIRKILGINGKTFPLEAESSLTTVIGNLLGDMTVKSNAKIEFENVPEIPAESKLYLHLAPNGEGLQVEFFVRPLGADGPLHRPGSGSERVIGEVGGQHLQAVRNLSEESHQRDKIIARYSAFKTAAAISKDQYVFETANDALTLLSELEDYKNGNTDESKTGKGKKQSIQSDDLEIYWPQGGNIFVSSSASFGNLSMSFASAEEWLAASGTLKVDKEVFDLQKLLELLDNDSDNRFVKISDKKFLALTNDFRKRLGDLKRLSQSKGKKVQLHPLAVVGLEDFFSALPSLQKNEVWKKTQKRIEQARNFEPVLPKDFRGDLRDYQLDGFRWMSRCAEWGVGCCLADDMGLGKTIQALALLLQRASKGPALVVAPTSVCFNWEREANRFAPMLNIKRIQSIGAGNNVTKSEREKLILSVGQRDVIVTSYTLLQQEVDLFEKVSFSTVILDEAQAIKNPDSNRAKAATRLRTDFRIAMTGTPIENNLTELWSLFRFLNQGLLGSQKSFEDRFAIPIQRDRAAGPRNTLRRLMQPFILRRTKSQVLEELPPRTEIVRTIEMSQQENALYEAARLNALSELEKTKDLHSGSGHLKILAALTRLRQLCCNPKLVLPESDIESSKLEAFREIMIELKENRHKVLVFSQFVKHLDLLRTELDEMGVSYQYLDGSTPAQERQNRVDAFQSGDYDAFLISIKAGGSGLNLTAADYVIHMDPWWNPAVEDQATDRTHRIGQTRPVTVYRLITQGTIEEKFVRLHHEKRDIADKLLEGTDQATKLTANELIDILRS